MKSIDEFIINIVEKEINTPVEYSQTIQNTMESKNRIKSINLFKAIITTIVSICVTSGIAFASYVAYEKIWKQPKEYNTYEGMINSMPSSEISEEEKKDIISEDEAKDVAYTFFENLGYENQQINYIELKRGYDKNKSSYYDISTKPDFDEGLTVVVDSKSGIVTYFMNCDLKYIKISADEIEEEKAKQYAMDICKKLKLNDKYQIKSISQKELNSNNILGKFWSVILSEKNSEIDNKFKESTLLFTVINNNIIYHTIHINSNFEEVDNPVLIEKQKAIEIAINKEKSFTDVEISDTSAELSVDKMNTFVYQLEHEIYNTDPGHGGTYLEVEDKVRNVWKVTINHKIKKDEMLYSNYSQYIKENYDKEYYIDTTTGEILGGSTCIKHI